MKQIKFTVKGSPKALKRHRHLRNGHTYDPSKADKRDFLQLAKNSAPKSPLYGPISMQVEFYIERPKAHFRSGKYCNLLKDQAPVWHITRADLDNYIKLVLDSLNGVFYKDDSQVCQINAIKIYSKKPRTMVLIRSAE
jgi:Holliday junction resolvase RusA-like endonuclease